jgi:hypothetical protein
MTKGKYKVAVQQLRAAMPAEHTSFLQSLKISRSRGKYFLCHAGVRPGVPLEQQIDEDLLWIRDEFLNSKLDFGTTVVHGHTPHEEPEVLPNRINIDTGAFATGLLTCVVLDESGHRFLQPDRITTIAGSLLGRSPALTICTLRISALWVFLPSSR